MTESPPARPLATAMRDVPHCGEDACSCGDTCLVFPDFESPVLESFIAVSYGELSFDDIPAKHRDENRRDD